MAVLEIGLSLVYFSFVAWLVIDTYINYVLAPFRAAQYSTSNRVSVTYALLWGLAITAPIAYGLLL